jgi:hypothetical protein
MVSVLGHVRATREGAEVDLGPPKHRALLAALAMAEGQPLDADTLAPLVWPPGQAPANPVSGLHVTPNRDVIVGCIEAGPHLLQTCQMTISRRRDALVGVGQEPCHRTCRLAHE